MWFHLKHPPEHFIAFWFCNRRFQFHFKSKYHWAQFQTAKKTRDPARLPNQLIWFLSRQKQKFFSKMQSVLVKYQFCVIFWCFGFWRKDWTKNCLGEIDFIDIQQIWICVTICFSKTPSSFFEKDSDEYSYHSFCLAKSFIYISCYFEKFPEDPKDL